ncbi:hypothetical protein BamIOP4010DRAFT_6465 [Burkholderia ambifaria IOP40-10]|uniref:Uncharacterized protein n=1 Tax=Burkholderia ambifaria IOP40-10 TaxID=396596 RepID=B1FR04_9BURK|nr:hypothetical protein [Burkholderia ambifaria]EDT00019.1 hypothetical protein BamIOP4010DRAFT_6465 [Burkholderia ambifaria IOP40-10]
MVDTKELAAIHCPKCDLGGIACIEQMFCVQSAHRASDGKLFDVVFCGACGHVYGVLPLANLSE